MSVRVMADIYDAKFVDITFKASNGFEVTVKASTAKSLALALADHSNDQGRGAYPGLTLLEHKTEFSRPTVVNALQALRAVGIIRLAGISEFGTNDYTISLDAIRSMSRKREKEREKAGSKATLLGEEEGSKATLPGESSGFTRGSKATLPEVVKPLNLNHPINHDFNHPLTVLAEGQPAEPGAKEKNLFDQNTPEGRARKRVAEALERGARANINLEEKVLTAFRISPNWKTKTNREFMAWLKDRPANETVEKFAEWWWANDWRGKAGQPPSLQQIQMLWPQAFPKRAVAREDADAQALLESKPEKGTSEYWQWKSLMLAHMQGKGQDTGQPG